MLSISMNSIDEKICLVTSLNEPILGSANEVTHLCDYNYATCSFSSMRATLLLVGLYF